MSQTNSPRLSSTPKISFFTTCMGRTHHLKQTMRKNMDWNRDYPNFEFVLLDYNSPDDLSEWVRNEFAEEIENGTLVYFKHDQNTFFNFSHSRNMAARLCSGEIICNLDADNFTGENFLFHIAESIQDVDFLVGCIFEDGVFTPRTGDHGVTGRFAIRKDAFLNAGGYDEAMVAWGYEDMDLFNRLHLLGHSCRSIDAEFLDCIMHDNQERVAYTETKCIGRDLGASKGSLLDNQSMSLDKIARGNLVPNQGDIGRGEVTCNFAKEKISLEMLPVPNQEVLAVREANDQLLAKELQQGAAVMEAIPNILFLELTRRCNLACPMCRSEFMTDPSLDMSEEVLLRIEEDLLPTARLVDLRGWGESLLRKDFFSILERFSQPGVQLRLLSNGTVRKPGLWQQLMRKNAWVGISLDSVAPAELKTLRGASLKPIEATLTSLVRWRDRYGNHPDSVFLTVVVSSTNLDNLDPIVTWAHNLGVGRVHMIPIACMPEDPKNLSHRRAEIPRALDRVYETAERIGMNLQFGASLTTDLVIEERLLQKCIHPWMYTYISYAGDVGFCDHLIGRDDLTSGNLLEQSFQTIWNSPPLVSLRTSHVNQDRCHPYREHCNWCFDNRYADFEHHIKDNLSSILVTNQTVQSYYQEHETNKCFPV